MGHRILLATPPFVQPNTPYSACSHLQGFLEKRGVRSEQADLSLEVTLSLFSAPGLEAVFDIVEGRESGLSPNARRMLSLRSDYIRVVDDVVAFLQGRNQVLASLICDGDHLPEASRFSRLEDEDLEWAFGAMGISDKARHLATLFLDDLSDLIVEAVDPRFGFSRYAERLGVSASSFDGLDAALRSDAGFVDTLLTNRLEDRLRSFRPTVVALTVPFPGCLYGALRCGQWVRRNHPEVRVVMGGGYANTELRSLKDPRVFDYVDHIILDDGEAPLVDLLEHFDGVRDMRDLKRTFARVGGKVRYFDGSKTPDFSRRDLGVPSYAGLDLGRYVSVLENVNPMHRLWSDGMWHKLTLAHGCYWGKCSFCDTSLDYIKRYEPNSASAVCDMMEEQISKTGRSGFHFVDEAAPPALLKDLAVEIIRRGLPAAWWTNIRFEKSFTPDVCRLLKESGCVAVAGGLEVASDRLLKLINKGVTVGQVARAAANFTSAGIMTHTYLMYGFPTQTASETIDSLEVVRQLFARGLVQSGFWHHFAMTVHSGVGRDPGKFKVSAGARGEGDFANNELVCVDKKGCRHSDFSGGLAKALYNYMHGVGLDFPLGSWFDFEVPGTTVAPDYLESVLAGGAADSLDKGQRALWLGGVPTPISRGKKNGNMELLFEHKKSSFILSVKKDMGEWLRELLPSLSVRSHGLGPQRLSDVEKGFKKLGLGDFDKFVEGRVFAELRANGLLLM